MQKEVEVDLGLRQKVATFDGYHDFTTHISQNRISARESIGGRFVEVPYYELSLTEINLACDRHGIDFTLQTVWRDDGGYEFYAYDEKSGLHGVGSERAIALCNLFVAVMEDRLAKSSSFTVGGVEGKFVSSSGRKWLGIAGDPITTPLTVKTPTNPVGRQVIEVVETTIPFTRDFLQKLRAKARFAHEYAFNSVNPDIDWLKAYGDLAIAADRLDAMLARQELDELTAEIAEE